MLSKQNPELPSIIYKDNLIFTEFIEENQHNLREGLIHSSIKRLKSYLKHSEQMPIILNLGLCTIEIQGTEAANEVLEILGTTIKNI